MYSMTGYGKASGSDGIRRYELEVRTVNHRYLDLNIRLPDSLIFLEGQIRRKAEEALNRGRVDIYLKDLSDKDENSIKLEKGALKGLLQQLGDFIEENAKEGIPLKPFAPSLELLLLVPGMIDQRDTDIDQEKAQALIDQVLTKALEECQISRWEEGQRLSKNLEEKLSKLKAVHGKISQREPDLLREERERMDQRVQEILQDRTPIDPARLENEMAIYASKAAIDEELVRLQSHFTALEKAMNEDKPMGKTMDFIVQEMNREVNTIGSKSNDGPIRSLVIEAKTIIEQIRQQVQNVE